MTKMEVVDKLKIKRKNFRNDILRDIHETITMAARGGHFPDFNTIVKQIMSGIAREMLENKETSINEWIVMLQEKEPDKHCETMMSIIEETCQ